MSTDGVDTSRRRFLTWTTAATGAVGAAFVAWPFIASWRPSARAQAAGAPVEVDLTKIEMGQRVTYKWRGKPVAVVKRSPEMLARLAEDQDKLRDPNSEVIEQQPAFAQNEYRSRRPEVLVLISQCTHLGCIPNYQPEVQGDWNGGFFCPCHGSKFDLAGRVYQGVPAPTNLPVPPYSYIDDNTILIGGEEGEA